MCRKLFIIYVLNTTNILEMFVYYMCINKKARGGKDVSKYS